MAQARMGRGGGQGMEPGVADAGFFSASAGAALSRTEEASS